MYLSLAWGSRMVFEIWVFSFRKKPTIASGRLCDEGKLFEKLQSKPIGHFKRQGVVMEKVLHIGRE